MPSKRLRIIYLTIKLSPQKIILHRVMTDTQNILIELKELNSQLADIERLNPFTVRDGYFASLPDIVLSRIRAASLNEEPVLTILSAISLTGPYTIPQEYFEGLAERMLHVAKTSTIQSDDEIREISPLLSGLKNKSTYSVPDRYFELQVSSPATSKVVKMNTRKIFRYAAAAVVTSLILLAGFFFLNNSKVDPSQNSYAWVEKSVKKVSTDNLNEFIELVNVDKPIDSSSLSIVASQIKVLIRDVPESEIESFLNDTEILDDPSSDDLFLN